MDPLTRNCERPKGSTGVLGYVLLMFLLSSAVALRGVAPDKLGMYTGPTFRCLTDRNVIPADRVNDDSCDCKDGSDEPGTSACPNGTFYCANKGHKPRKLPSTFVDDGVCDCCDGSDERAGCNDTCTILRDLETREVRAKLEGFEAGAKARAQLVQTAQRKQKEWQAQAGELEPLVATLKESVDALEEAKNEAQRKQEEVEEKHKAAQENSESTSDNQAVEEEEEDELNASEIPYEEEEAHEEPEEATEEDPDEIGKRIASQWTSNPEAAGDVAAQDAAMRREPDAEAAGASGDGGAAAQGEAKPESLVDRMQGDGAAPKAAGAKKAAAKRPQEVVEATEASKKAVQAHNAKSNELRDAEAKLKTAKKYLDQEYGADNVYAYMANECVETKVEKYTYRICGFEKAAQVDGTIETSLGTFSACEDGCRTMKYTNGAHCWQGPQRSMTVHAVCGQKTQILEVREPDRCVYQAILATPAECSSDAVKELQDELASFGGAADDVKDEL